MRNIQDKIQLILVKALVYVTEPLLQHLTRS